MKILWLDVETTGLLAYKQDIIQLSGIVEIDGQIQEEFDFKLAPINVAEIQQSALDVNGRTRAEILSFPDPKEQVVNFCNLMDKYVSRQDKQDNFILAGYNIAFDRDFLTNLFKRVNQVGIRQYFAYKDFDVYTLVFMLTYAGKIPQHENMKLATICKHFGLYLDAHDSLNDIRATREVFQVCLEYLR